MKTNKGINMRPLTLLEEIEKIPIVNDHTHIFGCGKADYDRVGRPTEGITPEGLVAGASNMNMQETCTVAVERDPEAARRLYLALYAGRRTTFPVRALVRAYREFLGFQPEELTLENAAELAELMRAKLPAGVDALYAFFARLTNTEVWFCNHGGLRNYDTNDPRTACGRFRWVPNQFSDAKSLNDFARKLRLQPPDTEAAIRAVLVAGLKAAKAHGAVAIKGGAFAYNLRRPFAPDVANLKRAAEVKVRIDGGSVDWADQIAMQDVISILLCKAAGEVGLPVQIHVGLIWTAHGPARIPEIMDLTALFHACPDTTFVIFHAGYPRTDDLAHVAATMTNVRAEFNWAPFWAGGDFPRMIGKWLDMIPNDRIIYGTDGNGFSIAAHDLIAREGMAQALEARIARGCLTRRMALEIAANILRNNSIAVYKLNLPKYIP